MRLLFAVALVAACLIALSHDGQAKIVCGQFDGSFTCKNVPGFVDRHKNPTAVGPPKTGGEASGFSVPPPAPATDGDWGASTTQPPSQPPSATAQTCPPNTELLGGNCVPYTARCKNGMALDAMPQACAMEEKQVCRPRGDGLKDCCCLTYSKF